MLCQAVLPAPLSSSLSKPEIPHHTLEPRSLYSQLQHCLDILNNICVSTCPVSSDHSCSLSLSDNLVTSCSFTKWGLGSIGCRSSAMSQYQPRIHHWCYLQRYHRRRNSDFTFTATLDFEPATDAEAAIDWNFPKWWLVCRQHTPSRCSSSLLTKNSASVCVISIYRVPHMKLARVDASCKLPSVLLDPSGVHYGQMAFSLEKLPKLCQAPSMFSAVLATPVERKICTRKRHS
jgi:hypothetical protein